MQLLMSSFLTTRSHPAPVLTASDKFRKLPSHPTNPTRAKPAKGLAASDHAHRYRDSPQVPRAPLSAALTCPITRHQKLPIAPETTNLEDSG